MSHTKQIKITRPLATLLLGLAQQSADSEICGLVAQENGKPTTVYPIRNIARNTATTFEMDAQEQITAFKTMRENKETLFAVYHSHPNSPPTPSEADIKKSGYPDAYHLIISLNIKGVLEMRAYSINQGRVNSVELSV